jgi:starch-binding outer membrane protein, SusD/RagB family
MRSIAYFSKMSLAVLVLLMAACTNDLNRLPFTEVTSATVYNDPASYKQVLAKIYAGMALSGQQGPAGKADISGIDEGFSTYLRQYFKAQELTTDEAVIAWNDGSIHDYHRMVWTSTNEFVAAMYNRIFYQITLCNELIRESTDTKVAARGISDPNIKIYRAEARFMRALSYYHALDMFGSTPFVTELDATGAFLPRQASRQELFNYVESELKAIENDLVAAKANEYGRADKAAAWSLLAKLYLNAKVYIGTDRNTDCITYCNKVIGAGYTLDPNYKNLFLTDNDKSPEFIFAVRFDGLKGKSYGGMTFMVHAPVGGSMNPAEFGINGGWGGLRTTKDFVANFPDTSGKTDTRALFYGVGQTLEINDLFQFTQGLAITKFRNVSSTGVAGSDPTGNFVDTDFPMFRLADVYLMYAEAVLRGGAGGDAATALGYINALRARAYKGNTGNITAAQLTLPFILDERARELYWECTRRTDLIRYDQFTTANKLWSWKGGIKEGKAVSPNLNLFPIPAADIIANPNLKQNAGY